MANEKSMTPLFDHKDFYRKWRDPAFIKVVVLLVLSVGLAVNGLSSLIHILSIQIPFVVDAQKLLVDSLCLGAVLTITLVITSAFILGQGVVFRFIGVIFILIGAFGVVSTVFTELREINIRLDNSSRTLYQTGLLDKQVRQSGSRSAHELYLADWNGTEKSIKVEVPRWFYQFVSVGDKLVIVQRNGYLNYRWIESLDRKE